MEGIACAYLAYTSLKGGPVSTIQKPSDHLTVGDILRVDLAPNQSVMAVMNVSGDKKTIWDRTKPTEVEAAKKEFEFFRSKNYLAYKVVGKDGTKGEILREFDPEAERIIFAPQMAGG